MGNNFLKRIPLSVAHGESSVTPYPPLTREEAIAFLKTPWQSKPESYVFLNQGQENLFVVIPEGECFAIRVRAFDAFGVLGFMSGRQKAIELDFGLLLLEDVDHLLKLFYEGNYLALRSIHRGLLV